MTEDKRDHRSTRLRSRGMEVFEVTPVILGGSPTDPSNKVLLNREDHIRAVVYWNRIIKRLREEARDDG